jgi:diguanylate cyclase (GGDEF)-like protein
MCRRSAVTLSMHVDLITLYLLVVGTLLASSAMTLWEHRAHSTRSKALKILAAAYATLAMGCAAALYRHSVPGVIGSALSNLVIFTGYLLILHGVASLNGRRYGAASIGLLAVDALAWVISGTRWQEMMWAYGSAFPIAAVSGITAYELLRHTGRKRFQSQYIAAMVAGVHAVFYAFRSLILPWLAVRYGKEALMVSSVITMYEGVLYSVVLPMTLLRLVREEAHGQLLRESQTDYLTGLGNRRWFFEEGARLIRDAGVSRPVRPVSLLAFDLDHFKTINDQYGHETGDAVLRSFADVVRSGAGSGAIVARIGGEEFVALLPDHDSVDAKVVGEAVVRRFAETITQGSNRVGVRATVSIGLAQFGREASTLGDLLSAADQALYSAKARGGNRVELAQSDAGSSAA